MWKFKKSVMGSIWEMQMWHAQALSMNPTLDKNLKKSRAFQIAQYLIDIQLLSTLFQRFSVREGMASFPPPLRLLLVRVWKSIWNKYRVLSKIMPPCTIHLTENLCIIFSGFSFTLVLRLKNYFTCDLYLLAS